MLDILKASYIAVYTLAQFNKRVVKEKSANGTFVLSDPVNELVLFEKFQANSAVQELNLKKINRYITATSVIL